MDEQQDQIFDNNSRAEIPVDFGQSQPDSHPHRNKTVIISSIIAVLVLGLGLWFLFGSDSNTTPVSSNVVVQIQGPTELVSDNEAEYKIVYSNGENADLVNITLEMFYPSGFKFKSSTPQATNSSGTSFNLPAVKESQKGEVTIRGKLTGATGETKQVKALMHYRLSNFNSEFSAEQTLQTSILPPNIVMDISGPVDVVQGQDTSFNVTFTNVTNGDFDNLALSLTYPDGFIFSSSSIPPSRDNNYWKLSKLASGSSASINITGSFTGLVAETKLVKADLGQIINNVFAPQLVSTATFRLIPSSLAITLSSDVEEGFVNLGDNIDFTINYANQGSIGLNNLTIVVNLEGPSINMTRLSVSDAIISGKTLTWKAATLPGLSVLSPNEKGEIRFGIQLMDTLSTNLKNQIIKATAQISANEISKPTKASDINLKLGSEIDLAVSGNYVSGAAPMQVGKATLFSMRFILSNQSNDLSNVKVVASLPLPASAWKNVVIPDVEKNRLSYDPNSGKITWNIGDVDAFVGKFKPAVIVNFQLEVVPTEVDRNKSVDLLSNIEATGMDSFTNQTIKTDSIPDISTSTLDDEVLENKGTTVQ
jgi:hypothetical protein